MLMPRIGRRLAAVLAAGATVAAVVPAPAGAMTSPCTAAAITTGTSIHVVLTVHAVEPNASRVYVACKIVQFGAVVAHQSASGSVAAASAGTHLIAMAPYTICTEYHVAYAGGPESRWYNACG